jgi:hypothetical protein
MISTIDISREEIFIAKFGKSIEDDSHHLYLFPQDYLFLSHPVKSSDDDRRQINTQNIIIGYTMQRQNTRKGLNEWN